MPKPWGVTALFAEYTGTHPPLDVDWSLERGMRATARTVVEPIALEDTLNVVPGFSRTEDQAVSRTEDQSLSRTEDHTDQSVVEPPRVRAFATFWEFAVALNRSDPAAVALAGDGVTSEIPIDGGELRKLLGMMWFRTVLGRLSGHWRDRVLNVLIESAPLPDHPIKRGRQMAHLRDLSFEELQEIGSKTMVPDWIRPDLDLLITVGRFWGADALKRFRFVEAPERREPSMVESLLDRFR